MDPQYLVVARGIRQTNPAVGNRVGTGGGDGFITFGKQGAQIWALNSRTFHGNGLPAPADVLAAIKAMFR
jgi:hypothetical protein